MKKIISIFIAANLLFSSAAYAVPIEAYRSFVRGLLAGRAGNLNAAINEYEKVIYFDKNVVSVYKDLAYLYWQAGMFEKAFKAAARVNELAGNDIDNQLFLGNFYLMIGDSDRAKISWEKALSISPDNENAILYLAAYYADKNPGRAMDYWKQYIKVKPDSAAAYFQLGLVQEKMGWLENAKISYRKAISLEPQGYEPHLSLAQVYEKENNIEEAIKEYEEYLKNSQDNLTVMLYLGGLYYRLKKYDLAENTFKEALKKNPQDLNIYYWLGIIAEHKKDWKSAIENFENLKTKDESTAVLMRLSYYYSASKDYKTAIKYLEKTIEKDPSNPSPYYLLALACFDFKKYSKAEKLFKKTIELSPDYEEAYFHLGVLYDTKGKFERAAEYIQKAIKIKPDYAMALNYLGYSYIDRGMNLDIAKALIEKALSINPKNAAYMDSLGWYYFKTGSYAEAEKYISEASVTLEDSIVYDHLGDIEMKLSKPLAAWEAYRKALDLNPGNKKIKKKIEEIEKLVLPGTIQRKALKRAVGNLLQIRTLSTNFSATFKTPEFNFSCAGSYRYERPDKWRLDILGNFMSPKFIVIHDKETKILPKAVEGGKYSEVINDMNPVLGYFNADLLNEFDSDKTVVDDKNGQYVFTLNDKTLIIDKAGCFMKQFTLQNGITIKFKDTQIVEGLYLPTLVELSDTSRKILTKVKFSSYILNEGHEEPVFNME